MMFIDDNFKFPVSVSTDSYWNKEDVNACVGSSGNEENKDIRERYGHRRNHKMSFRTIDVTAPELLNYCLNGYSFCNLFTGFPSKGWNDRGGAVTYIKKDGSFTLSAKKNEYFYGSNAICIDIDSTAAPTIQDYVDRLSHKPTFWYTTFSHMDSGKGIRFRMVYALAEPIIGQQQFDAVVDQVHGRIESEVGEVIEDKCGEKCSQYFNGTNVKNNELVVEYKYYGCIYCIKDIYNNVIERENNNKTTTYYTSLENNDTSITINTSPNVSVPEPYYWLLHDIDSFDYDTFMKYNRHKYTYTYRMDYGEWINDTYQIVPENYFELYWPVDKLYDGCNRRKKIFERMCLRRVLNPNIDIDTIIYCAYVDYNRFCDNSDHVFGADYLERNAKQAFELSLEEIEIKYSDNIAYLRSRRPKDGIILKSGTAYAGYANALKKDIRYSIIDQFYDVSISVKENLALLPNLTGLPISKSVLYEYCKDRGISFKVTDEDVLCMLNPSLSVRDNLSILKDAGIHIGTNRVNRLLNQARAQQAQQPLITHEQPLSALDLGSTTTDATANGWSGWSWSSYTSPFGF